MPRLSGEGIAAELLVVALCSFIREIDKGLPCLIHVKNALRTLPVKVLHDGFMHLPIEVSIIADPQVQFVCCRRVHIRTRGSNTHRFTRSEERRVGEEWRA